MLQLWLFVLVAFEFVLSAKGVEYSPVIQLKDGKVIGTVEETEPGHKLYKYQGIRYGRAKRFEKPLPAESWADVYNATHFRDACPQAGLGQFPNILPYYTETMSEDCLYLNVWRPIEEKANRTVMVWIYGGGYQSGTIFTIAYDGKYLSTQGDVVVVSVNYRLGAFGFLNGGTADAPGNLGLHDQVLALNWVRDNIHHFGGDPHRVTIFGESAGSFAVGSLILSPLASGLFTRAIMQSGAPNSYFGKMSPAKSFSVAKELARQLACPTDQMASAVKCLRAKSVEEIVNATIVSNTNDESTTFKPIYGDSLLPIAPEEALKSGKFNHDIDLMFGVTSHEGSNFVRYLVPGILNGSEFTLQSTHTAIKELLDIYKMPFSEEVAQRYTSRPELFKTQTDFKLAMADAWGDLHVVCPTVLFGEQFARLYSQRRFYSYRLVKPSLTMDCPESMGVCHAEDISHLFIVSSIQSNAKLLQLSKDMIHAWTSFAKTGQPGKMGALEWTEAFERQSNTDHSIHNPVTRYMSLDSDDYKMVTEFYKQTCDTFWKPKLLP